jgi:hypothetical protein
MATLEELQSRRDALFRARAGGVRSVSIPAAGGGTRAVEYKSDSEMAAAIAALDREMSKLQGGRSPDIVFTTSKGF